MITMIGQDGSVAGVQGCGGVFKSEKFTVAKWPSGRRVMVGA